jgi:hypothetical protein
MKNLTNILTLIILTSLNSCEQDETFKEPQPSTAENLSNFPLQLQGQYISLTDNSKLNIGDKFIERTYDYMVKMHPNQLDKNKRLSGDTIIDTNTNEISLEKHDQDSLLINEVCLDKSFEINNASILRKFKGQYFLNVLNDNNEWDVKMIQLIKGQLTISTIKTNADIENLKEIIQTANDTIPPYEVKLTKDQSKEFVKDEKFRENEIFIRTIKNAF